MMSRSLYPILALAVMVALCAPVERVLAGSPGEAGLLSMRLGIGGRGGGMGETGVATAVDATAMYWNPANMAYAAGTQVSVQHMEYFGLFRQEALTLSHETPYGSFGLIFSGFYSDDIDRTAPEPVGVTQGTFRPYDVVAGLGYSRAFEQFAVGVVAKFAYERVDAYSGSAPAVDIGITHRAVIDGLVLAAAVQNLGPTVTLDQEEFNLPRTVRAGLAYRPLGMDVAGLDRLLGTAEIVMPNDGNSRLHAGVEFELDPSFQLRAGHRFQYDTWGPTFGAGFQRAGLRVDYAFMSNANDFDTTHRFSLSLVSLP
jgi:hypothetical protein